MQDYERLELQLFAGEGDGGGEGAETGESAVVPGQQRLLELGVPADKIRKHRAYKPSAAASKPVEAGQKLAQGQPRRTPSATNPTDDSKTEGPARLSWEQIMADPEYNKQMQLTVQSRLRDAKSAQDTLGKLTPALELLARKHGQDPASIDYDALAKSISEDESFYRDKAVELGVSLDTAKRIDQRERDSARQQRQMFRQHIQKLEQQGEAMKQVFPGFDLRKELQNPVFARMTSPNVGIRVEDAYYAVHRNELQTAAMQVTAQKTAQRISNAIASGSRRPSENGTSGQAPSVTAFDYSKASKEQRDALKAHIRSEAAQGRKVYPGSFPAR